MKNSEYIEEEFIKFYNSVNLYSLSLKEANACESFYDLCISHSAFTEKQAIYLKLILKKYHPGYDTTLNFRHPFRILDERKIVYVKEEDQEEKIAIAFKFPYHFLETFDKEFETSGSYSKFTYWDPEEKARKIELHNANYLKICNFVNEHGFFKEPSFLELEAYLQEAINRQDEAIPYSIFEGNSVSLQNAEESSVEFFLNNKKNHKDTDALLAKIMGFPVKLVKKDKTQIEHLVSSNKQFFWLKDIEKFFSILKTIKTKTCIMLDRDDEQKIWLKNFIEKAQKHIPEKKIKICFRESQEKDPKFNQWVKETGLGGKVDQGDVYIFQHKPPKWILNEKHNMLFIATTMINPPSNLLTQDFFLSNPCVIHLTDVRPTEWRKTIVEL